jgi:hypothetical protein
MTKRGMTKREEQGQKDTRSDKIESTKKGAPW